MQLLTATKLSTVAMLVMASFLLTGAVPTNHQDVAAAQSNAAAPASQPAAEMMPAPAVPTEQPDVEMTDVVKVAPVIVQPPVDISAYKSVDERPSQQAKADMLDILSLKGLDYTAMRPSYANDPQEPFSTLPDEVTLHTVQDMDLISLRSFAQTDQRHFNAVHDLLSKKVKQLVTKMDTLWERCKKKLEEQGLSEDMRRKLFAASSVWEKTLKEATGQKELKDCPYDILPNSPDFRHQRRDSKYNPSVEELLEMMRNDDNQYKAHMRHNICRLAVNGGYPWLMRIISMDYYSKDEVFSVLGQLRLYSPDKALASDSDRLLKLFAAIARADGGKVSVPNVVGYLLMLSYPTVIPALGHSTDDITRAALLLLAIKQQQLNLDGISLPESVKRGEVTEFINNAKPELLKSWHSWYSQCERTLSSLVQFRGDIGQTHRQGMNDLLDHASKGFEKQENVIQLSDLTGAQLYLHPLEVLVNLLTEDESIKLYDEVFKSKKNPLSVVFAGRSRQGTRVLEHVFEHVFGPAGASISDDIIVDGKTLNAEHLAQLAMVCAISCTEQNRKVFFKLLVKKIQDTPQLPGNVDQSSSSSTAAQQVASEVLEVIREINERLLKASNVPADRKQSIQDEVNQVIEQLNKFATELSQGAVNAPSAENSSGSLQSLRG